MIPHNRLLAFAPAGWSSPLVAAAEPANLRETAAGEIRVALGTNWAAMLTDLRRVGPVLSITRNSHAVIGREAQRFQPGTADFDFEFGFWHHARAVHGRKEGRNTFAIEWFDAAGEIHHKTCLTPQSDLAEFADWVNQYQALGEETPREPAVLPRPVDHLTAELADGQLIHRGSVDYVLREAISQGQSLRVIIGNNASVQGHSFTPVGLRISDQWCFIQGDHVGIHLRTRNLAEVLLLATEFPTGRFASLKLYDPEARLVAAIQPPPEADARDWNDFILSRIVTVPSFPSQT